MMRVCAARFWVPIVTVLVLVGCARSLKPTGPKELIILHTNDIHGKFTETPATWVDGEPPIGGYSNLSVFVQSERMRTPNVLLVDAGDLMTGNPICDYDYEGVKGGAMMAFMNMLDYDAMCVGNHEFDHGLEELEGLLSLARFPVLSANTYTPDGDLTAPARHVVVKRGGLRVGIIGLLTEDLYGVAAPSKLAGTRVTSTAEEAQRVIDAIDAETDLIVLLTHLGVEADRELARRVRGADIIVGGHSHTRLTEPERVNGVLIVQAGAHNRNLGRLRVVVDADRVVDYSGELIELWPQENPMPDVHDMEVAYAARVEGEYGSVIGRLAVAWERAYHAESNIGNWLTDQLREHGNGDFALLNSGGIRKDVSAGPITRLDVLEILPFSNVVTSFTCTGADVLTLIAENARAAAFETHGILQVSGIRYAYEVNGDDVRILSAEIGGKPVDPAVTYRGISVDYVSHGNALRYMGFDPADKRIEGGTVASVIMERIQMSPEIDARVDGRMSVIEAGRRAG